MTTPGCATCGKPAQHTSPTGRALCDTHYRELAGLAGAGVAMVDGQSAPIAVAQGIATAGYAGSIDDGVQYQRELAARVAAEPSFWRRMKLRIIG
jgi:hypothetical protein